MIAHPVRPQRVGTRIAEKIGANGRLHGRAMRDAGEAGGGYVRQDYERPDGSGVKEKLL